MAARRASARPWPADCRPTASPMTTVLRPWAAGAAAVGRRLRGLRRWPGGSTGSTLVAGAKLNLCLYLGPIRDDGRHELVTVMEPLDLHDTVTLEPGGGATRWSARASRARTSPPTRCAVPRATGWDGPPVRLTIDKRIPVAAGLAAGGPTRPPRCGSPSATAASATRRCCSTSRRGSAPTSRPDRPAHRARHRRGRDGSCRSTPAARPTACSSCRRDALSTGAVYAEADRLGLPPRPLDGVDIPRTSTTSRTRRARCARRSTTALDRGARRRRRARRWSRVGADGGRPLRRPRPPPGAPPRCSRDRDPAPIVTSQPD